MLISLVIAGAPAESASPGTRHPGKHKGCNDDAVQQHASIEALETIESDGINGCVIRYAWLVGRIVEAIATEMILLQHEPDVTCI